MLSILLTYRCKRLKVEEEDSYYVTGTANCPRSGFRYGLVKCMAPFFFIVVEIYINLMWNLNEKL
jgi:hypothetical protein